MSAVAPPARGALHPAAWFVLILPFGALGGFVGVGLVFLATRHGLSITEGALLGGASLLSQWLKWLWAPLVDVTLTPKRWYVMSALATAAGLVAMSAIPLGPSTLTLLLAVIALTSLLNTLTAMAVETTMAHATPPAAIGRAAGWLQAGNLGGSGLGGGLGLWLLESLPAPWMAGAAMGALMLACCAVLPWVPDVPRHDHAQGGLGPAVRWVVRDWWASLRTRGGALSALLLVLPVGTGAAAGVLTQAAVAARWGAGVAEVALMQGVVAGLVTAAGCFAGGWICQRHAPRATYAAIGLALAAVAAAFAIAPPTVATYVVGSLVYSFGVGIAYAAFTAVVLEAIGTGAAATKYTVLASLSNFPIWWLGLLLGWVADHHGAPAMLHTEAVLGVAGVAVFGLASALASRMARRGAFAAG
ncbi:MAG TPA: MFS transporter [Burkholderiaceae bacterium]|nr:MFS transporter [Burkholderiaceae bacterium]